MKALIVIIIVAVLGGAAIMFWSNRDDNLNLNDTPPVSVTHRWHAVNGINLSFQYPIGYDVYEPFVENIEPAVWSGVVFENTETNREIIFGEAEGTDGPMTVTIAAFMNSNNQTAQQFIELSPASNFNLSDGELTEIMVGEEMALSYLSDGLWQYEHVVVAKEDFVYMFSVGYNDENDEIRQVFRDLLNSVRFITPDDLLSDEAESDFVMAVLVREHAMQEYSVSEAVVKVLRIELREWSDACLGLPSEEEMCAQVITPGYEAEVEVAGRSVYYRLNEEGDMIRSASEWSQSLDESNE